MRTALQARGLRKVYAQGEAAMVAVDAVDLDVHHGELTLLMGPSGSGKTTLVSILGGILRPTSGSVSIDGRQIDGLNDRELSAFRLRHIGFVFQGFNLFPTLSALQNVELAFDLRGIRGAAARRDATELLDQVGLAPKLHTYPAELSGGQKQRVAIARALVGSPTVLLADEPTAALDSSSGHTVMHLFQRLARERGRAVVIVTHDGRMQSYANRIVQMADGRVVSDDYLPAPVLEGVGA
ncbi:MAG: ABC transporter ATP-binding protein [Vicinamibacterales bacterium]